MPPLALLPEPVSSCTIICHDACDHQRVTLPPLQQRHGANTTAENDIDIDNTAGTDGIAAASTHSHTHTTLAHTRTRTHANTNTPPTLTNAVPRCRYETMYAPWECGHERHTYEKCQVRQKLVSTATILPSAALTGTPRPRHSAPSRTNNAFSTNQPPLTVRTYPSSGSTSSSRNAWPPSASPNKWWIWLLLTMSL